jgi:hypothetical protein
MILLFLKIAFKLSQYKNFLILRIFNVVVVIIFCYFSFHFTLKISRFHMNVLINHMLKDIYKMKYQYL